MTIEEGLSHNTVNALIQDNKGFIWIGTQNGLNRYDAYEFKVFDEAEDGFSGRKITAIFQDSEQTIWVGTENNGIYNKTINQARFARKDTLPSFLSIGHSSVTHFYEDSSNNLWISTLDNGLLCLNKNLDKSKYYNHENSGLSNDIVFGVQEDGSNNIWVATAGNGINLLTPDDRFVLKGLNCKGEMYGYRKTLMIDGDDLWLGTDSNGLYLFDTKTEKITSYNAEDEKNRLNHNSVRAIRKTRDGHLLVGTDGGGLNILNLATGFIEYYKSEIGKLGTINSNAIFNILEDIDGNLWIGTFNGGLNIVKSSKNWFESLNRSNSDLENHSILSINQKRNGNILLSTDGAGLYELDSKDLTKVVRHFGNENDTKFGLSGNVVKPVLEDSDGKLWIGMFRDGLDIYDPKSGAFLRYNAASNRYAFGSYNIWSLVERRNGEIWIGTLGGGIYITDKEVKTFKNLVSDDNDVNSLSDMSIFTMFEDIKGTMWIGTAENGLCRWDDNKQQFVNFKNDDKTAGSLSGNTVRAIFEDSQNRLWIGTEGDGLNLWNGKDAFQKFDKEDGLIGDNIMGISEDDQGYLWLSSYKGLSRMNLKTFEVENFDFHISGRNNQFNQSSILNDKLGTMYFGGINGLNTISTEGLTDKKQLRTKPVFTFLKIYNKTINESEKPLRIDKPIEFAEDIRLTYNDKSFTIGFTAFDFSNAEERNFEYKLDGFDTEWQMTKKGDHIVNYTNLDPGDYVFMIRYGDQSNEINILVRPPFWKTWWFRLLLFAFLIVSIFFLTKYYVNKQEDEFQKQLLVKEKEILALKNKNLEEDVILTNSKLVSSTAQMARKNEFLNDIRLDLQNVMKGNQIDNSKVIRKIEHELQNEDYWAAFTTYFENVDKDFVKSFVAKHPDLTQNDIRLSSLIRINLSTKEIASMLNISVRGAEKSRYRLKKRLELDTGENLVKYIQTFKIPSK